jgi:WhiB family transcriptional regulator, redox-sensing transcriptional regulator
MPPLHPQSESNDIMTGSGTYPATRSCPRCGQDWVLLVDREARRSHRIQTCGHCRMVAAHTTIALEGPPPPSVPQGDWVTDALCAQIGNDTYFAHDGHNNGTDLNLQTAKRICGHCPVQPECLAWALTTQQPHGIWGGLSTFERRKLLAGA